MKKYFMGIKWIDAYQPIMHLKDYNSNKDEYIVIPNVFDIEKKEVKICSGAINPLTQEYFPCKKIIELNQDQCYSCMHKYDFYNCVKCHGYECTSEKNEVLEYCNTAHYVYLAYFSKNKIKVGTVSEIRKYNRLLEQGAIYFIFIAKTPTGRIARQIEKNIIDSGITGAVTTAFKMKNLIFNESTENIKEQLLNTYQKITKIIDEKNSMYLIQPEFNYFNNFRCAIEKNMLSQEMQIDMFGAQMCQANNYEIIQKSDYIIGDFLFVIGKIIALRYNGIVKLYDSKKWEGFLFDFKSI